MDAILPLDRLQSACQYGGDIAPRDWLPGWSGGDEREKTHVQAVFEKQSDLKSDFS